MATEQGVIAVTRASRPTFRGPHDYIVRIIHSSFLAAGYILPGAATSALSDNVSTSFSTGEVVINGSDQFGDNYDFVYSSPGKGSTKISVKCLAMNDALLVDVLKNGDEEPLHFEINAHNYTIEIGDSNYSAQFKDSGKLVSIINKEILGKLSATSESSLETAKSRVPGQISCLSERGMLLNLSKSNTRIYYRKLAKNLRYPRRTKLLPDLGVNTSLRQKTCPMDEEPGNGENLMAERIVLDFVEESETCVYEDVAADYDGEDDGDEGTKDDKNVKLDGEENDVDWSSMRLKQYHLYLEIFFLTRLLMP